MLHFASLSVGGFAAQQVVAPDRAIESLFGACFVFAAFWVKFSITAKAARRVSGGGEMEVEGWSEIERSLCRGVHAVHRSRRGASRAKPE